MSEVIESRLRVAISQGATDLELCQILNLSAGQLERHRALIDQARAECIVRERYAKERRGPRRLARG